MSVSGSSPSYSPSLSTFDNDFEDEQWTRVAPEDYEPAIEWVLINHTPENQDEGEAESVREEAIWLSSSLLEIDNANDFPQIAGGSVLGTFRSALNTGASSILYAVKSGGDLAARGVIHSVNVARDNGPTIQVAVVQSLSYGQTLSIQATNLAMQTALDHVPTIQKALYTAAEKTHFLSLQAAQVAIQHAPALQNVATNVLSFGGSMTLKIAKSALTTAIYYGPCVQQNVGSALLHTGAIALQAAQVVPPVIYKATKVLQPVVSAATGSASEVIAGTIMNMSDAQAQSRGRGFAKLIMGASSAFKIARITYQVLSAIR